MVRNPHRTRDAIRESVAAHRARLRSQGLRPIQLWVPDTRNPQFRAEAERQSRLVDAGPEAAETLSWIERVSVFDDGDDAPR